MIATWLQILSITLISWVITTAVMPKRALMSLISPRMESVVAGSRALVASSHKSTAGFGGQGPAMATRCFWPPESWRDRIPSCFPGQPAQAALAGAFFACEASIPASSRGKTDVFQGCPLHQQIELLKRSCPWNALPLRNSAWESWQKDPGLQNKRCRLSAFQAYLCSAQGWICLRRFFL